MRLISILIAFIGPACIHTKNPPGIKFLDTRNQKVQNQIVGVHNYFRTLVYPRASDMMALRWSPEAAIMATSWAQQCKFEHSPQKRRESKTFEHCGENLALTTDQNIKSWYHMLYLWFNERKDFRYGRMWPTTKMVGHYTAVVWSDTTHVGCGVAFCPKGTAHGQPMKNFYHFVCNYCPSGNIINRLSAPYKLGHPCASCPKNCFKGKLCLDHKSRHVRSVTNTTIIDLLE